MLVKRQNEHLISSMHRRNFLCGAGSVVTVTTRASLTAHTAWVRNGDARQDGEPLGLAPVPDQNGAAILALPAGFNYVTFSHIGETMSDGTAMPRNLDGMAAFNRPGRLIRLIRNHGLRNRAGDFTAGITPKAGMAYDMQGMGGTTTMDFDPRTNQVINHFVSLGGTIVNCSGGLAYRDQS